MNGMLHLGHAFTITKVEFAVAYHRLRGKKALFPFGFHCAALPIKACADKLMREVERYGAPPVFETQKEDAVMDEENGGGGGDTSDPTVFKAKKAKAAKKAVGGGKKLSQWEIMEMSGIESGEISRFQDPQHWLRYFPPFAIEHLKEMGCGIDWRRSFITTDANPYFDSFVRWNLTTLRKRGRVVKDTRYAIYSPMDGQPCMDHDRQSGEGVNPQEYTIIKMKVKDGDADYEEGDVNPFAPGGALEAVAGKPVFLAAATLRPETMYGQTNCWVLPSATYGCFEMNGGEVWVMLDRAALNASYQGLSGEMGEVRKLCEVSGADLVGLPLRAPLTSLETIYALPLLTILTNKGTGVVTSVPSDAPDDYIGLQDLKRKPDMRAKFGVKDKHVMPFDVIPIINIPEFGDASAVKVCTDLKIASQNDKRQLEEAKRLTYLKGFTDGVMLVGEYAGKKVQEAKPLMRKKLIESGEASPYCEPEKEVMSRSGDECVVALTDQWYITYGDDEWLEAAQLALEKMNCYADECKRAFHGTLDWLRQWACSRSYGLGTKLPWDPEYLIESLSDSTIYMAYYTVAHILQNGDVYGESPEPVVPASAVTHAVWDYLLLDGPEPGDECSISPEILRRMKREFDFWYPFDLRVSGKDLIQNHLTFSIYQHAAIWDKDAGQWPLSFRCNGHVMVNSEKMSKSIGNFKTLKQALDEYSADAMRLALADAGDGLDDANFAEDTANAAILRLTKELDWFDKMESIDASLRRGELSYADRAFMNEVSGIVARAEKHYENLMFREALREAWFEMARARDTYRLLCDGDQGMHADVVLKFTETFCVVLAPITPHWSEHVWSTVLKKSGTVLTAGWPSLDAHDAVVHNGYSYLIEMCSVIRLARIKLDTPKKKQKVATQRAVGVKVYIAREFSGWHALVLDTLEAAYIDGEELPEKDVPNIVLEAVRASSFAASPDFKKQLKNVLAFARKVTEAANSGKGRNAFARSLPFDELEVLSQNIDFIKRTTVLEKVEILPAPEEAAEGTEGTTAVPEQPELAFETEPLS